MHLCDVRCVTIHPPVILVIVVVGVTDIHLICYAGWFDEDRHDDATLLRFLRARRFDLAKTKEMIMAAEKWRKEFGVADILKCVFILCVLFMYM